MTMSLPLVSVVIPVYNAEKYLEQTIRSVLTQTYTQFEILCINDGSTDASEKIVLGINDPRILYFHKINSGVSDTRNYGLKKAAGKYILFLDSDDILDQQFLSKRVEMMEENPDFGFCASRVIKIDSAGKVEQGNSRGPFDNKLVKEILLYNDNINTCPSIFLIKKSVLIDNGITFNIKLSSSADRFFMIELSKVTRGGFIANGSELYYRVHPESMSHKLTDKLIADNKMYYLELKQNNYIPKELHREFSFKINYILAGSFYKLEMYLPCLWFSLRAFYFSPFDFIKQIKK
jgi:glycosyltransferase involved in cell wall biosynthesis